MMESLSTTYGYQNKKQTCTRFLFKIAAVLAFVAGTISCSQKFPIPTKVNDGILVIPLEVTKATNNKTLSITYKLKYSPETLTEIIIKPSTSKKYVIVENFPVGQYETESIDFTVFELNFNQEVKAIPFTIKANKVTLLPQKFVFSKSIVDGNSVHFSRGTFELEPMGQENRENLFKKLKNLENADLWKFE